MCFFKCYKITIFIECFSFICIVAMPEEATVYVHSLQYECKLYIEHSALSNLSKLLEDCSYFLLRRCFPLRKKKLGTLYIYSTVIWRWGQVAGISAGVGSQLEL
jgi:hypothetical protein